VKPVTSFAFRIPEYDEPIDGRAIAQRVEVHPGYRTIVYSHATFTVRAHIVAALDAPGALILLDVESVRPLEVLVGMHADFNLQWPGGFGGQHIGWNAARRGFQLTQGGVERINGVVASPCDSNAPAFGCSSGWRSTPPRAHAFLDVIAGGIMPRDSVWRCHQLADARIVARRPALRASVPQ
jgi:hypothetical protein